MLAFRRFLGILALSTFLWFSGYPQISRNVSVEVSVNIQQNPPALHFHWRPDPNATSYTLYRKAKDAGSWGIPYGSANGPDSTFIDTAVTVGMTYEYRVYKFAGSYTGNGYVYAGIEAPAIENRGTVILLVDSSYSIPLESRLNRLMLDLTGDGWKIIRHDVPGNAKVLDVKALIINDYNADSTVKAVFILGHITVPYSGNLNPDAHNNHIGAWAADTYYGDINGNWTDQSVNNTSASRTANHNVPGDGKFDQSLIPSDLELAIGRVDLINMPQFAESDTVLLQRYLDKDHDFRHKVITAQERGIVDDNFASFQEGFAGNGWRNFAAFFGYQNVSADDYFGTLANDAHLWAYGCGAGSYTSCGGVGNTAQFASDTVMAVFNMLFGSYFGDWDSDNNFLRAPLASQTHALTNVWAGRPHWQFHHMALGDHIGYSAIMSQNNGNGGLYPTGFTPRGVHTALMGDPTLRMHIIEPVANLTLDTTNLGAEVNLSWDASTDPNLIGYYIYAATDQYGPYSRIHSDTITATSFSDTLPRIGMNYYMVRALALTTSASGSYYNLSQGIFGDIVVDTPSITTWNPKTLEICPGDEVEVSFNVIGPRLASGNEFQLQLSDSTGDFSAPTILGFQLGTGSGTMTGNMSQNMDLADGYRMRVTANNPAITGSVNPDDLAVVYCPPAVVASFEEATFKLYPNPSDGLIFGTLEGFNEMVTMEIFDLQGKVIHRQQYQSQTKFVIDLGKASRGMYFVKLYDGEYLVYRRILIQ